MQLITPSKWLANLTKQSFLKEYPVDVIHNTIDTHVFKPTPSDLRERFMLQNKFVLLGVASIWGRRKGMDDFVKLASMLDEQYAIVLVGVSEKQKKSLPTQIISVTRTNSPAELAQLYTMADVFLNLTYEDNYPTVNLEAQACGTPCITYRTGGSIESVPDENIIEQGDLIALQNKLSRMLENSKNGE